MKLEGVRSTTVTETILQQLGGYRFTAMTGAKDFVAAGFGEQEDTLRFKVPRCRNGTTTVAIRLNGKDLYDVRCYKIKNYAPVLVEETLDVYADQLRAVFEQATGLCVSL